MSQNIPFKLLDDGSYTLTFPAGTQPQQIRNGTIIFEVTEKTEDHFPVVCEAPKCHNKFEITLQEAERLRKNKKDILCPLCR